MGKTFITPDFLLSSPASIRLYHEYAAGLPIIDYHNHLPPAEIATNKNFETITQAWLQGDHYKWRAMRTNGVPEHYITGTSGDWEKFEQWALTVPYTLRNPLYHWTHLELIRYFSIDDLLDRNSARVIFESCNASLTGESFRVQNLLARMKVEVLCTTDDPADSLEHHLQLRQSNCRIGIYPSFRPDQAMNIADPEKYNAYLDRLEAASGLSILNYDHLLEALRKRQEFFHETGCRLSDHGLEEMYAEDFTEKEIQDIFAQLRLGQTVSESQQRKFKSALLLQLAEWNHEKGWVQQYHIGAMRNNNSRMMRMLGADSGWDSIGHFDYARSLSRFLDRLDARGKLAKTILYNLDPSFNAVIASMTGNFNDGSIAGKIQFGAAWWFLDQKEGIIDQLNTLSQLGLISRFVGMLTDSRSFLSFPRHEYFRRILCNLFGTEIEAGELPADFPWIGKVIQQICYYNAKEYFELPSHKSADPVSNESQ